MAFSSLSIAKEETRESATYGTLTTADEIKEVAVPKDGILHVGYTAAIKSSVSGEGRAAIFIGENQLKADKGGTAPAVADVASKGTTFHHISSCPKGLETSSVNTWTGDVTTGQALCVGDSLSQGGTCMIFGLPEGSYNVSLRYRALSGSVTSKERHLYVEVPE